MQWSRRPTQEELDRLVALEEDQRAAFVAAIGPARAQALPPAPNGSDTTVPVYACVQHAITRDLAALIHQATCAPDPQTLPACTCVPEPGPAPEPLHEEPLPLPDHWT
ncbi:hypothetical protein [Peterkaempfera griseoplana]|uniref:hypothetical protein n=1 Tax=Peterkaempfera griseoplana TaxID=66896 RepID=UPI0006E309D0|nr:hypothetical protein [Peterkaempfera griseoplana]